MYRVLVVDDEPVIREGIKDNIEWEELGFEFAGECENGNEAIEAVGELQPDVVLTDICMPFVDGLELTKYIMENYSHTKVIILTGYDEFEYAQQAVKLKASDFVLKPITASELKKILIKVKNELDDERRKLEDFNRLKMQLRESFPLLKERFLNRLVSGHLRDGELEDRLAYFGIDFSGSHYTVIAVDIDDYGELYKYHPGTEDELLVFAVYNICQEFFERENNGVVFQNRYGKTIVILSAPGEEHLNSIALKYSEEVRQAVEKYLKFTVTIGIGVSSTSLRLVAKSYKSALAALDYRFLIGKNHVINITDMEKDTVNYSLSSREWENKLLSAVKTCSIEETVRIIDSIIEELKHAYASVDKCYVRIQQVIIYIFNALSELGIDEKEIFDKNFSPFIDVYNYRTLDEIKDWLNELCGMVVDFIVYKRNDYSKLQVLKAEEYIKENYNNPDISLNAVCKHLFISTSYFSLLFKNKIGRTFVEYLTGIRVDKAKELLTVTNLRTYEIASKVGYSDPHYFSLIFKKNTGMTPTEYREVSQRSLVQ
ncbi:MAG: response regulator [Acetivibrionales bacterium]|jgi:two-component system response regulator YesN